MQSPRDWRPASAYLTQRAELLAALREFFAQRAVLEVETPALAPVAATDPHIESFRLADQARWLQSSPEFHMKRLLAAGSGSIYQIARAFRAAEVGRWHNPEFTLLEWYRPKLDHFGLMNEVAELLAAASTHEIPAARRVSYREAFIREAGLDPFDAEPAELEAAGRACGLAQAAGGARDELLDFLMGAVVGPRLGRDGPEFVYDYPATQAALARVRPGRPPLASRFELYWHGVELANGFHELSDPVEQRRRFEWDNRRRRAAGQEPMPIDEALLAALAAGLPDCSGVALGVDRLLAVLLGHDGIARVLAFGEERA